MTPAQFAGANIDTLMESLPAAMETTTPCASAMLIASCIACGHEDGPPWLRLIRRAGFGFSGAPATGTPTAQRMAAGMSSKVPPQRPRTRTGRIFAFQFTPAMPTPLSVLAAIKPLVKVPCQELGSPGTPGPHSLSLVLSPGSDGSLSCPPPSLAKI